MFEESLHDGSESNYIFQKDYPVKPFSLFTLSLKRFLSEKDLGAIL
jgi:hypothetical protein